MIKNLVNNFITSGSKITSQEELKKIKLVNVFTLVGATSFFVFGYLNFLDGKNFLGVAELVFGVTAIINVWVLRRKQNPYLASFVVLSIMFLALFLILFTGGFEQTGYLWFFTYPVLSFFLMEREEGLAWAVVFLLALAAIYFLQTIGLIDSGYEEVLMRQLIFSLLAVTLMIYMYVGISENYQEIIARGKEQYLELKEKLEKEIISQRSVKEQLDRQAGDLEQNRKALLNLLEDLNEEKKATESQAQELLKFKLAVEHASDHIIITDSDGKVIYANPAAERTTGYSQEEILGQTPRLWGQQMTPEFYEKMWHTIKNDKKPFDGEITNRRKSGQIYIAVSHISPILDAKGNVIFFVGIERDVTTERQVEKLKDEFISIASHELRTPMTAIKGFVSMILDGDYGDIPTTAKEPLQDISTSTERLIRLVNDMLNISRIEAGRMKYEVTQFDAKPVVEQTVASLQPVAKERKLSLTAKIESVKVAFDQNKLTQVLNNLVGNALKFTKQGKIEITSQVKDDQLVVYVADTGIGIAPEAQKMLFTKFGQVKDSSKSNIQGTGLGLYISKNITQKLGGDVWIVKSTPGKGTVFGFALPLAGSEAAKDAAKTIEEEAKENPDQKEMS